MELLNVTNRALNQEFYKKVNREKFYISSHSFEI